MTSLVSRVRSWFTDPVVVVDPTAGMTQRAVYDFGYQNGYAWGEVVGRKQTFEDILHHLSLSGRTLEELLPADVEAVRTKSTH